MTENATVRDPGQSDRLPLSRECIPNDDSPATCPDSVATRSDSCDRFQRFGSTPGNVSELTDCDAFF